MQRGGEPQLTQCQRLVTKANPQACNAETVEGDQLCLECLRLLRKTLVAIKEIVHDLEIQITKQDRGARSVGGGGSHEAPLPFDLGSSEALSFIGDRLAHWFADVTDGKRHSAIQGLTTENRVKVLLWWHLQNYVWTGRYCGPDMLADFDEALLKAVRAVDRKTSRIWIGNCDCNRPVHAYPNQKDLVDCECGQQYDPAKSRRDMRVLGGQQIVSARQAESLGEVFGRTIKRHTILQWHRREKLLCRSEDRDPVIGCYRGCNHVFLMSDILTLHKEA